MSKKSVVDFTNEVPRRGFTVYDNSDSIVDCSVESSRTLQSDKDACDINIIVGRAEATGFAAWTNQNQPQWGVDVSGVMDYKSARDFVFAAEEQFMELPAKVRARFDNDPGKFLAFVENPTPESIDEGRKLGIYAPPVDNAPFVGEGKPPEGASAPVGASSEAPKSGARGSGA